MVWFQSLSGFQPRCDLLLALPYLIYLDGFNPCRVFSLVAMITPFVLAVCVSQFQSLSGFQPRCDGNGRRRAEVLGNVSIPVGFSASLRLLSGTDSSYNGLCFNPCRVFSLVAMASSEGPFWAIILSKSPKIRPPGMDLFRTRP